MAYKAAYLAKAYSIPPALIVNNDQIGVHLVPNGGKKTWEPKGTKHVQMLSLEDKRQVTIVVSSNTVKDLLPPQIVFIGSTPRTLPPNSKRKTNCINDGWDLTFCENHWSSLETTKQFVQKILLPYLQSQIQLLGLKKEQKMVWIIDYWNVHINEEFYN